MAANKLLVLGTLIQLLISPAFSILDSPFSSNQVRFYDGICPGARDAVKGVVKAAVTDDKGLAPALLRLLFHDCAIRGCDASVLLDSTPTNATEKDGQGNANSIRGFEVIDAAKEAAERLCPGVVSCADILALAARDAIALIGGPSWGVASGRRDGLVSHASETQNLPSPLADYNTLVSTFAAIGLSEKDLVVLSGAHTFGITHCGFVQARLYNSTGENGVDPTIDAEYAESLKKRCPFGAVNNVIPLDPSRGNNSFDSVYYQNVQQNKGVFISDAALITTESGSTLVAYESSVLDNRTPFFSDFAASMEKMSKLGQLSAPDGEIRASCHKVNGQT